MKKYISVLIIAILCCTSVVFAGGRDYVTIKNKNIKKNITYSNDVEFESGTINSTIKVKTEFAMYGGTLKKKARIKKVDEDAMIYVYGGTIKKGAKLDDAIYFIDVDVDAKYTEDGLKIKYKNKYGTLNVMGESPKYEIKIDGKKIARMSGDKGELYLFDIDKEKEHDISIMPTMKKVALLSEPALVHIESTEIENKN